MALEPIKYMSFNLGPDAGSNDMIVAVRVVPDGKKGDDVYGRTLNAGEPDTGEAIIVEPGNKLVFPAGTVKITLRDSDQYATPEPDGYAPVANTVWTWLQIPPSVNLAFFHYMLATARRLDTAHGLYVDVLRKLGSVTDEVFMRTRARTFDALGSADAMCIALNGAIRMIAEAKPRLSVKTRVPSTLRAVQEPVQAIRDAFEHIDERAFGGAHRETPIEAISIFNQDDLLTSGTLRYANRVLDIRTQVLPALIAARQFVYDVIAEPGTTKTVNQRIEVGPLTFD